MESRIYQWDEIFEVPAKPGVYAWYYSPEFTDRDLKDLIDRVKSKKEQDNIEDAQSEVYSFLYDRIFRFFQEEPYEALLKGSLKPEYGGKILHTPSISQDLINRIVEQPERVMLIRTVLGQSTPLFSSPIYIGMSKNLFKRINNHKNSITSIRSKGILNYDREINDAEKLRDRDRSFALRVCQRCLNPAQLSVSVLTLKVTGNEYVDIENILNRVHYPILGRN